MSEKNNKEKTAKPAKKGIGLNSHPKMHKVNVSMTDGSKFEILTVWGKEGDKLSLDVDPKNHPAWQVGGQNFVNVNNERLTKFKEKFGDFNF